MSTIRGFIAIDIPLNSKIETLKKEIQQTGAHIKLVEPENTHITLKFLGDVNEDLITQISEIMDYSIHGQPPFPINLRQTGVFPNKNYIKVVWIGIQDNTIIASLARKIDDNLVQLGFPKEKRPFSAHLTIGRVKTAEHKQKLLGVIENHATEEFGEIFVRSIAFKKSVLTPKGPIYTTIHTVNL